MEALGRGERVGYGGSRVKREGRVWRLWAEEGA